MIKEADLDGDGVINYDGNTVCFLYLKFRVKDMEVPCKMINLIWEMKNGTWKLTDGKLWNMKIEIEYIKL